MPTCKLYSAAITFLRSVFADNKFAEIAASLVTHYRHEHIAYCAAAWQNRAHAEKIPGYDHEVHKELVNNRAKGQMIRALARAKLANYLEIVKGFSSLQSNDDATVKLIEKLSQSKVMRERSASTEGLRKSNKDNVCNFTNKRC